MLLKLFKTVTIIVLLAVLVTLIQKRDLITERTTNSVEKIGTSITLLEPISLPSLELKTQTRVKKLARKLEKIVGVSTSTNSTPIKVALVKAAPSATETKTQTYETLKPQVAPDTDETYQPTLSPCKVPMGFKIGTLDQKFGISKDEFISIVSDSAQTWKNEIGRDLFLYNPSGPLTINLIYDERQERTVDLEYYNLEIENAKKSADDIKTTYENEKAAYVIAAEQYTKDAEIFKAKYTLYENKVNMYNQKGGANQEEYNGMMTELAEIQKDQKALEERRIALNVRMNSINTKVQRYNEFVVYVNSLIRKINTIGSVKFTEGRFTPSNNTIDIFQFNDRSKLKRVITHELGHGIGINHNSNISSIMYSANSGTGTSLSTEDIASLEKACAK